MVDLNDDTRLLMLDYNTRHDPCGISDKSLEWVEEELKAARDAGKTCRVAEIRTQAPDHAALLASDETTYLKFYVLQVR